MDLHHRLEILRRSMAMLNPDQGAGLSARQVEELLRELAARQDRLDRLEAELRCLTGEGPSEAGGQPPSG